MTEEIRKGLFRIEVPLPNNPLRSVNCYAIRGGDRSLIIDTGLNRPECLQSIRQGVRELEIDLAKSDFFITHFHTDHLGLVGELAREGSRVYFNQPELDWMMNWGGWEVMFDYGARNGFPRDQLQSAFHNHPGARFAPTRIPELQILSDGDQLRFGGYTFRAVSTPGHSPGHICLYEPERKLLISGDHVLGDITPNIQCWSDEHNPLQSYLDNLDKVRLLETELVLPGHRGLISDPIKRIDELKAHHHRRLNEVLDVLDGGPAHAYRVASRMSWDIEADSWDDFPLMQKWFATGEAIAHLRYLEEKGAVRRKPEGTDTAYERM
ncbi:MAG: MBL fold metallo-hydrolase [Deltaproteobacteria bacterium]|nr:MBL fold metallo-hydrolase [Deltaproteobacteria bacterium]